MQSIPTGGKENAASLLWIDPSSFYDHPDQDGVTHSLELPPVSAFGDTPIKPWNSFNRLGKGEEKL